MNVHLPAPRSKWPGRLMNLAVVVVVLALAGATFVLSYTGVHVIAVQAGVSARFARLYPGVFDAVFVIACVAAVMLRDGRWWARLYAWLVIIVMVVVVGAADAVHAMNVALPRRETEGVVAAVPWVLVLLGFSLMLTMLRHSRGQHAAAGLAAPIAPAAGSARQPTPADEQAASDEPPAMVDQLPPVTEAPLQETVLESRPAPARAEPVTEEHTLAQSLAAEPATTGEKALPGDVAPAPGPTPEEAPGTPGEEPAPAAQDAATAAREQAPDSQAREEATVARASAVEPPDYWDAGEEHGSGERDHSSAVPEVDQDAPPFATAPFATIPRLNRVRSTPIPPEDDED